MKQGDNLAPILFVLFINAVTTTLEKKWKFTKPDFRWFPNTKNDKIRGKLNNITWRNKGTSFNFFQSFYVDDAAFILLSRTEAIEATKTIVKHFKRFGLTVHTGSKSEKETSKTEFEFIPAPGYTATNADTTDIKITEDSFISHTDCFQYLG